MDANTGILITVVMYLLLIPGVAAYLRIKETSRKRLALTVKGASTAVIVLSALTALTLKSGGPSIFDALIVIGLTLGLVGDVVIGVSFLAGMAAFAAGHLCYIGALLLTSSKPALAVPIWAVFYAALLVYYKKSGIKAPENLAVPSAAYAAVIAAMLSLAFTVTDAAPVLLPAAVLFTASDFMLAFLTFAKHNNRLDQISLWCYYVGQSLFAVSVIMTV
jgi:uncharacterized membrane protein YhhN